MADSPTARRRVLGQALKELRENAGKSPREAADALECSESKVRKIEAGDVPLRVAERNALLALYGAEKEDREEVLALARGANQRGWWQAYSGAVPRWFRRYIGLESDADEIRTFETELVPGLFQVENYTRALIEAENPEMASQEIDRRLKVRAERQERTLTGDARVFAVLSEAAIRREVGGPPVITEQLRFLLETAANPRVELQVLPFSAGAASAGFPFTLLRFPGNPAPSLAYTENLTSAAYHDRASDLATYTLVFDRLRALAMSPATSAELIKTVITGLR